MKTTPKTKAPNTITLQTLVALGACEEHRTLFESTFGTEAKVTKANVRKALKAGLNLDWAAGSLLTKNQRAVYTEATAPAWKVYTEATAPARKVYVEATAQASKVYSEAEAQAWKVYSEETAQASKVYSEAKALAFYAAWKTKD